MRDSEVGKLDIVLNASADKVLQEVDRVNAKFDQMEAKVQQTTAKITGSNQQTGNSFASIGAGISRNIAAIDQLGNRTDALLGKQHTAWLAIGALVGGTTQQMIQKVTGFIDRANAVPDAVEQGLRPLVQQQYLAVDSLRLSNAELEKQTALLEKKPVNNQAIAIAEDRVEIDKLATSLDSVNTKMNEVLSKEHIAGWQRLLGKGGTATVEGTINSFNQQISDLAYQQQVDARSGDTEAEAKDDAERRAKLAAAHKHYQDMLKQFADRPYLDNSGSRSMLQQADTVVMNEQDSDSASDQHKKDQAANDQAQARQRAEQEAKEAAAAAQAAQQKQYRDTMAAAEQGLANMQREGRELSVREEVMYWERLQQAQQQGSLAYLDMNRRIGTLIQSMLKANRERIAREGEEDAKAAEAAQRGLDLMRKDMQKSQSERAMASVDLTAQSAVNAAKLQELELEEQSSKSMSRLSALTQRAAINTQIYGIQLDALLAKKKLVDAQTGLPEAEKTAQQDALQKQIEELQANRSIQVQQDAYSIAMPDSSALVGGREALDDFVRATHDGAAAMHQFVDSVLNDFNSTVLKDITSKNGQERRGIWSDLGKQVFTDVASSKLKQGEGKLGEALGFGSAATAPKGTRSDPLWIKDVSAATPKPPSSSSGVTGSGGDGFGGIWNGLTGMSPGDMDMPDVVSAGGGQSSSGGGTGGFFKSLFGIAAQALIPGFASGTDYAPGGPAWVGEDGPEILNLPRGASVTPNNRLPRSMSGTRYHMPISIDARGATDPAQVEAAANRAIVKAAPQLIAASAAHQKDDQRRSIRPSR